MADAPIAAPVAAPIPVVTPTAATPATNPALTPDVQAAVNAAAAKLPPQAAKDFKKKFQLKVDGESSELELDMNNEQELIKHLQLSKASQKRMQESAEMRKGVQELLETLRTDPMKVLTDPRLQIPDEIRKKMAEAIINNELEDMAKSPEQKEKEKLQKQYEDLKKQVDEEKQGREKAEFQRLQEQQAVQLDVEMSEAIESSGLPKNARTVRYLAEAMMFCLQNGIDLNAKDLVPYVKKQSLSEFKEMIGALPDEDFENWLGKDQIARIRKRSIQRSKAPIPENPANIKSTGTEARPAPEPAKKIKMGDFLKSLGK